MAELGAFQAGALYRVSDEIRAPRIFYENRTLGAFDPSRRVHRLAFIRQNDHTLAIWGFDLSTGAIADKTASITTPSIRPAQASSATFSAEQYDVAPPIATSQSIDQRPCMSVLYWRPDNTLGVWPYDITRDEVLPTWTAGAGPAFQAQMSGSAGTWNGADGYLYNNFFAAPSVGDGPNQREVFALIGNWRGTSPVNYKGCRLWAYNLQTRAWRSLPAFPPPTWGIDKEQEAVALIPAAGDVQAVWKTQSPTGIITGGYKPRIEDVGATTRAPGSNSLLDSVGNAVQPLNEDPTINSQIYVGAAIASYGIDPATPPDLKICSVEQGVADRVHVYRANPHQSQVAPQWVEETVDDLPAGVSGFGGANLALLGDRAGIYSNDSGRQYLYADAAVGFARSIYRATWNNLTNRWENWTAVVAYSDLEQEPGELLFVARWFVVPGDDHVLIIIEAQNLNGSMPDGIEKPRVVYALFDDPASSATPNSFYTPGGLYI